MFMNRGAWQAIIDGCFLTLKYLSEWLDISISVSIDDYTDQLFT